MAFFRKIPISVNLDYGPGSTAATAQTRQAANHDQKTLGYLRSTQATGLQKFDHL